MKLSRAVLRISACSGRTAIAEARGAAPQRWSLRRPEADGWLETTHQFLGDGLFDSDVATTLVEVGSDARAAVSGITATPVRQGQSASFTRVRVHSGGALLWLPGPLVPHAGARHSGLLDVHAEEGAELLLASVLVTGRTGLGECAVFEQLRLRSRVRYGGAWAFREDSVIGPGDVAGLPSFAGYQATISLLLLGPRLGSLDAAGLAGADDLVGASALRAGGVAARGLFPHLGAAREFVDRCAAAARRALPGEAADAMKRPC